MPEQLRLDNGHYNTTGEQGELLAKFKEKATDQQIKILDFFLKYHPETFTPCQVHARIMTAKTPLTSTRRAITNLTSADLLVKTKEKRIGIYFGRPAYCWGLKTGRHG